MYVPGQAEVRFFETNDISRSIGITITDPLCNKATLVCVMYSREEKGFKGETR